MGNKNKNKGKRGESEVCKILTEIFELPFMRVFGSGSFFGGKNSIRFNNFTSNQQNLNEGDIVVPEELSHFSIEVKNYKDFPFHSVYTNNCALLDKWLEQSENTKKSFYMLFFKITYKDVYVCYPKNYNFLKSESYTNYKNKYIIELAKPFLLTNKNEILNIKNRLYEK